MPQAIRAADPAGRWAVYVPLTRRGKIVVPRPIEGRSQTCRETEEPTSLIPVSHEFPRILLVPLAPAKAP